MSDTRFSDSHQPGHDVQKLLGENPRVDLDEVRRVGMLLTELRRSGIRASEYQLESPYEHRCTTEPNA